MTAAITFSAAGGGGADQLSKKGPGPFTFLVCVVAGLQLLVVGPLLMPFAYA